ncbi:MAG: 2-amino-4-hydroxy-6-hydroxymethyldihydropteridine diphosphokinase [Chloroflexota bacterium]|nr:2-amino-4-hydroxy-6-hydroxymethyldihydropteridine diphosphokinase [Chloroflexota bacterium]
MWKNRYLAHVLSFIGLGANLGDPAETFGRAVAAMRTWGNVLRVSSLYATAPRDVTDQPGFVNAVVEFETELSPRQLLVELKALELQLGRDPGGIRYGPRLIDLDILAIEGRCLVDEDLDLVVPHPRLQERRFALEPLAEINPDLRPWAGCEDVRVDVTVADLLPSVAEQDVRRVGGAEWSDRREWPIGG